MIDAEMVELIARHARAVSSVAGRAQIGPDSRLIDDLALDSLDLVSLLVNIQDELGIELDLEDLGGVRTVSDVVALLETTRRVAA